MVQFDLQQFNEKQKDYIGLVMWWEIADKWRRPISVVGECLRKNNIQCKMPSVSYRASLLRGVVEVAKTLQVGQGLEYRARTIKNTGYEVVVGLVVENKDKENKVARYNQIATASVNKSTGEISFSENSQHQEIIIREYNFYKSHLMDDDLRKIVRDTVDVAYGMPLRNWGGLYFIPRSEAHYITNLGNLLEELGAGEVKPLRVPSGSGEKQVTWEAVKDNLRARIKDTIIKAKKVTKRLSSLDKRQDDLSDIEELTLVYSNLCEQEEDAEEIKNMLLKAGNEIADMMEDKISS